MVAVQPVEILLRIIVEDPNRIRKDPEPFHPA
jgi:hypothetical protein